MWQMAGRGLDPQVIENTPVVKDNQIHIANLAMLVIQSMIYGQTPPELLSKKILLREFL